MFLKEKEMQLISKLAIPTKNNSLWRYNSSTGEYKRQKQRCERGKRAKTQKINNPKQ